MNKKIVLNAVMLLTLLLTLVFPARQVVHALYNPAIRAIPFPLTSMKYGSPLNISVYFEGVDPGMFTGTITYKLYRASDPLCQLGPMATFATTVSDKWAFPSFGFLPEFKTDLYTADPVGYSPNEVGTWHWVVQYSGNNVNAPASTNCADYPVQVAVNPLDFPVMDFSLSTNQANAGAAVSASVRYSKGIIPSGQVTFRVYNSPFCGGSTIQSITKPLVFGGGNHAESGDVQFNSAGVYSWQAERWGDVNFVNQLSPCLPVTIIVPNSFSAVATPAQPRLGNELNATIQASGSQIPAGTIKFSLYDTTDPSCAGAPVYTQDNVAWSTDINGIFFASTSDIFIYPPRTGFTAAKIGTYHWKIYDNNAALFRVNCADLPAAVGDKIQPSLSLVFSSSSVPAGESVFAGVMFDGAQRDGLSSLSFYSYTGGNCTQNQQPAGSFIGSFPSALKTSFPSAGTYSWKAVYSGDLSNYGVTSNCASITVTPAKSNTSLSLAVTPPTVSLTGATLITSNPAAGSALLANATSDAGGTVKYSLYDDNLCTNFIFMVDTVTVADSVIPASRNLFLLGPGKAYWKAFYSGDIHNNPSQSACVPFTVTKASPSLTLTLSGTSQTSGTSVSARGGYANAAGIPFLDGYAFKVYSDAACQNQFAAPATVPTIINDSLLLGIPSSAAVTFNQSGKYYWRLFLAENGFNFPASTSCASAVLTIHPAVTNIYAAPGGLSSGACDTWASACDLQYAISIAQFEQAIWAKGGTYKPAVSDRAASFVLKNDVAIYGGFAGSETQLSQRVPVANPSILSGDIGIAADDTDNSYHVVTGSGTSNSSVLDGFTISAGRGGINNGGGLYINAGSPTLRNLTFIDNQANAGGAMFNLNASPVLENVTFSGNQAQVEGGGGMYNNTSQPSLTNVTFSGNSAGGFGGGGLTNYNSSPLLTNVTFTGNTANTGGGMVNYNSSAILKNTLLANNTGGDCVGTVDPVSASNLISDAATTCGLANGVNGSLTGVDPALLPIADNGGFTQTSSPAFGSPAIDAGSNTGCPAQDQRGLARPYDGNFDGTAKCDIGAVEFADLTGPNTSISSKPPQFNLSRSASFSFSGTDSESGVAKYQCSLDGKAFVDCLSPVNYSNLVLGKHNIKVRAVDLAGNIDTTPAAYAWTVTAERTLNGGLKNYGATRIPTSWTAAGFSPTDGRDTLIKREGIASVKITGAPALTKTLTQAITLSGAATDTLFFTFWARGASVPVAGSCTAKVMLYSGTTLKVTKTVSCSTGTYAFAKKSLTFAAGAAYTKAVVQFTYAKASGSLWIDLVSLVK